MSPDLYPCIHRHEEYIYTHTKALAELPPKPGKNTEPEKNVCILTYKDFKNKTSCTHLDCNETNCPEIPKIQASIEELIKEIKEWKEKREHLTVYEKSIREKELKENAEKWDKEVEAFFLKNQDLV